MDLSQLLQVGLSVSTAEQLRPAAGQAPGQPANATGEDGVTVLQAAGMASNAAGDLPVFVGAVVSNSVVLVACVLAFSCLRGRYPQIYSNNVREKAEGGYGTAPFKPSDSFFGWFSAGLSVTFEEAKATSGFDVAMLLEYTSFCSKVLVAVGVPMMAVLCPLHYFCGGGLSAEAGDRLSTISLHNVEHGSWLFAFHAFAVWYVVLVVEMLLHRTMNTFLSRRFDWLAELVPPRSTSVLVEGIPDKLCSDQALAQYFARFFPHNAVESACVVKHTQALEGMVRRLKDTKLALETQRYQREKGSAKGNKTPELDKKIQALEDEVKTQAQEARAERDRVLADAAQPLEAAGEAESGGAAAMVAPEKAREVSSHCGFVTFKGNREALLVMNARCSPDTEEMVLSIPPEPEDIIYDDLRVPPLRAKVLAFVGYTAIFGIFCSYLPFIVFISTLTQLKNLERIPVTRELLESMPILATILQGFLSSLGLVLFMSFLPTILMLIFQAFFTLKAHAWAQLRLQIWYFWFLVIFVLLITAVGASLVGRIVYLAKHPMEISGILADSLPTATHFYLNFMLMQWVVHAMNLTRYMPLAKYLLLRAAVGEARAVELSEPDQDYFGMGARSARWSLDLVLALVFCSVSPLITAVALVNFLLCRVFYGYLTVFAETRRHDLGGPFFVEKMKQVQFGLLLYVLLMIGIFLRRARSWFPVVVAGLALLPVAYCFKRFSAMAWEFLPFDWVISERFLQRTGQEMAKYQAAGDRRLRYTQPELSEENWGTHAR